MVDFISSRQNVWCHYGPLASPNEWLFGCILHLHRPQRRAQLSKRLLYALDAISAAYQQQSQHGTTEASQELFEIRIQATHNKVQPGIQPPVVDYDHRAPSNMEVDQIVAPTLHP